MRPNVRLEHGPQFFGLTARLRQTLPYARTVSLLCELYDRFIVPARSNNELFGQLAFGLAR